MSWVDEGEVSWVGRRCVMGRKVCDGWGKREGGCDGCGRGAVSWVGKREGGCDGCGRGAVSWLGRGREVVMGVEGEL